MKLASLFKSIPNLIPTKGKLEEIKQWSVQRRAMFWGVRVLILGSVTFLTYKGIVSEENFLELINGLFN